MDHNYTLFIDEAGDDKVSKLRPENPNGNSEWLCLGGYLVRSSHEPSLDERRDKLVCSIGGQPGQPLHFRKYNSKNRSKVCIGLARFPARAFVVCSYKKTMLGYRNERAEAAATASSQNQYLYNFVVRLLLERVTEFVEDHARANGIDDPKIRLVLASRKGHHFGHFKAYVYQLINQARANTTHLKTKEIKPDLLSYNMIERAPASSLAGLQLADALVSSVFQSIEQCSPGYEDRPAKALRGIFASKKLYGHGRSRKDDFGLTVYPQAKAATLLSDQQEDFFQFFGYDFDWIKAKSK